MARCCFSPVVVLRPPATHGYPLRTTGGEGSCTGGLKTHRVPQEGVLGFFVKFRAKIIG